MSYSILGQDLHETANAAKQYFGKQYGAKGFKCETAIGTLPLKPTWQARLASGYLLCIEVRESPFSSSLYHFVSECAAGGVPVRLWVAVPTSAAAPTFNAELKQARVLGIGVVQIGEDGDGHEFHRPVPLSLFGLARTDFNLVPARKRDELKSAESTFLDGSPGQGCQALCQELELVTRQFAEFTYKQGWWKQPKGGGRASTIKFFKDPWASVLAQLEARIDTSCVKGKCPAFATHTIVRARGHTDWRNAVSHKPRSLIEVQKRDARLRTMFEATRDVLIEWYVITRHLRMS